MLTRMTIAGFKAFSHVEIGPARLNVLVGRNGAGKSTLIQLLLMLRQSREDGNVLRRVKLNGRLVSLGLANEVVREDAGRHITAQLGTKSGAIRIALSYDAESANARELQLESELNTPAWPIFSRDFGSFSYLNAERLGPRTTYPVPSDEDFTAGPLGIRGEFTAFWMSSLASAERRAKSEVERGAKLTATFAVGEFGSTVPLQSSALLGYVTGDFSFSGETVPSVDSSKYTFQQGALPITRATNTGVGLSYCAPILVASLLTSAEGLFLVENPEAHLSPDAQSRLARVLACNAAHGAQTFVETHSDHVLNGIRLAVKDKLIAPTDVKFFYVDRPKGGDRSTCAEIGVGADGSLSAWPKGFFDQIERDLSQL